jgi:predicted anti-sigma-YlaC factor YlaD
MNEKNMKVNRMRFILYCSVVLSLVSHCSIQKMAINSMADALTAGSTGVFASDDDPVLVGDALPFALKSMEALLQATPENQKLLIATAAAFVQYTHAFVLWPANKLEYTDLAATKKGRERAKQLFLRARDYGIRALEIKYSDFYMDLSRNLKIMLARTSVKDVPALYWTGVAWGSAISVAKDDMALIGDLPVVTAMLERAIALDEDWSDGALHEFFLIFDAGRSEAEGGGIKQSQSHFDRAMDLNHGHSIGPMVSAAETICVRLQDRKQFIKLLSQALEFDVHKHPPQYRLSNVLAQQRAEFLLKNIDNLFLMDNEGTQ